MLMNDRLDYVNPHRRPLTRYPTTRSVFIPNAKPCHDTNTAAWKNTSLLSPALMDGLH